MRYIHIIASVVVLILGLSYSFNLDRNHGLRRVPGRLEGTRLQLKEIGGILRDYHSKTGRYPSNNEGLLAIDKFSKASADFETSDLHRRVNRSGVISIWGEPYIYENRSGLDPNKFVDSGATVDTKQIYSVKVDKDIYLWSLAAQNTYKDYALWKPIVSTFQVIVILTSLVLFILFIKTSFRQASRYSGFKKFGYLLFSLLSGLVIGFATSALTLFMIPVGTCYAMSSISYRSPELTKEYLALIDKYHERGVINGKAYEKIRKDMSNEMLLIDPEKHW